jgi:hypothetical protein
MIAMISVNFQGRAQTAGKRNLENSVFGAAPTGIAQYAKKKLRNLSGCHFLITIGLGALHLIDQSPVRSFFLARVIYSAG